tara:strand:- start:496 stop:1611 length:1116 start_codon:yes stop_codon:yes gene_type:complete
MKIKLFTASLIFITSNVFSQITLTDANLVVSGDTVYMAYVSNPTSSIIIGNSGMNQIWDFSTLQASYVDTELYISPVGTNYESLYSSADLCLNTGGSITYFDKNSFGVFICGRNDTVFNSPALYLPLPLTYSMSLTDGPIVVIEEFITGTFLSTALPSANVATLTNNIANIADTALIQVTNTSEFSVDASGFITTPLGTYDVLRLKEVKKVSSVLNVYCSDTITQQGMWYNNIPFSAIPFLASFSNNEQEITYRWVTNDNAVKYLVAAAVVDSLDNVEELSFQITPLLNNVTELPASSFNIYPVPVSDKLIIDNQSNELTSLDLLDVNGKVILKRVFSHKTSLDISRIIPGIYFLNLRNKEGSFSRKIIIN